MIRNCGRPSPILKQVDLTGRIWALEVAPETIDPLVIPLNLLDDVAILQIAINCGFSAGQDPVEARIYLEVMKNMEFSRASLTYKRNVLAAS